MSIFGTTNKELKTKVEELQSSLAVASAEKSELLLKIEELGNLKTKVEELQSVNESLSAKLAEAESNIEDVEHRAVEAVSDFDKKVQLSAVDTLAQAGHAPVEAVAEDQEKEEDVLKIYKSIKDKDERFAYYQANKKEIIKKSFR